jgi:hypothetical protein
VIPATAAVESAASAVESAASAVESAASAMESAASAADVGSKGRLSRQSEGDQKGAERKNSQCLK